MGVVELLPRSPEGLLYALEGSKGLATRYEAQKGFSTRVEAERLLHPCDSEGPLLEDSKHGYG